MPLDLCTPGNRDILERNICLSALSKNLKGELKPLHHALERCAKLKCRTPTNAPCDSAPGKLLDGNFIVRNLITAFENGDGTRRGIHEGDFLWKGKGAVAVGTISGITNAGTHREPIFKPCQTCDAKGWMEGRFCGTIRQSQRPALRGW